MSEKNVVGKDGRNPLAEMLKDTFEWSYDQQTDDFARMKELQNTYDNRVDDDVWPTISKIPIAQAWATVEKALGPAMDFLFPPQPFVKLLPKQAMSPEALRNLEWAIHILLVHRMKLKKEMLRSVKDCFKVGLGYGIVEQVSVSQASVYEVVVGENSTTQMGPGDSTRSLSYRYLSTGKVVPYPSGVDFNGRDKTPFAFLLDLYPQWQFERMYENSNGIMQGDPKKIITEARSKGFNSNTAISEFIDVMAGRKSYVNEKQMKSTVPIMIPVLKSYQEGRHTWMFCGSKPEVIFDKEGTLDTMRCPLVKLDAWVDGDRWYPFSQPEADQKIAWAKNIWLNLLYDLATWGVKRPMVYDLDSVDGGKAPQFGPEGVVGLVGDVNKTARFLDPPGIDQGSIEMGRRIDAVHNDMTGEKDFTEKNYTRGGTMAFQDLMQDSGKRDRLRYSLLQTGGLESIAEQSLLFVQTMGEEMDLTFEDRQYSQDEGEETVQYYTISPDDVKRSFSVMLDLDSKYRYGAMDVQNRIALYDRKKKDGAFSDWEIAHNLCSDEYEARREILPRKVVQAKQEAREAAEQAALVQQGMPQGAPTSIGQQAMAGAEMGGAA